MILLTSRCRDNARLLGSFSPGESFPDRMSARIAVHSGLVLALWDRENGLGVRHADL